MVVLAGCSAASPEQRLDRLVNDQELPADIRLAVAQKPLPSPTRRVRPARQAKSKLAATGRALRPSASAAREPHPAERRSAVPVETMSRAAFDALFGIVCDANVPDKVRRKAAVKLATYFLPKKPVNKRWWFAEDGCGFANNGEIAREYRAIDFELQALNRHPNRDFPEFAQTIGELQARRNAIRHRLECPCPTRYEAKHISEDLIRLVTLAHKRNAGFALTAEEDTEEAHRKARYDCYVEGPEQTARHRRQDLQSADNLFRKNRFFKEATPPLSRQERNDLRLLRWLYPHHYNNDLRDPEAKAGREATLAYGHPFHDAEPAADGNLYPHDSKLRPASAEESEFIEFADNVPRYCIAISGQPMIFTNELPASLQGRDAGRA
jgi:hypothetical protein